MSYGWSRIGGHLALDLANTVSWRLDPARLTDRLADAEALADWYCALTAEVSPEPVPARHGEPQRHPLRASFRESPAAADRALDQVRDLRDATTRRLDAHLGLAPARPSDAAALATAWRRALAAAPPPADLPWRWTIRPVDPAGLVHALALAVGELFGDPGLSSLRRCDGEGCGWLFLDSSRNHSRRWCDPADCGNRTRVRAHARRRRIPAE